MKEGRSRMYGSPTLNNDNRQDPSSGTEYDLLGPFNRKGFHLSAFLDTGCMKMKNISKQDRQNGALGLCIMVWVAKGRPTARACIYHHTIVGGSGYHPYQKFKTTRDDILRGSQIHSNTQLIITMSYKRCNRDRKLLRPTENAPSTCAFLGESRCLI